MKGMARLLGPNALAKLFAFSLCMTLVFCLGLGLGLFSYEHNRKLWANDFMPGSLAPCLRLGAFGLPPDSPTVLLAGDSRILNGLDPHLLQKRLGLRTRNIADAIHFGGNLATLTLVLKHLTPKESQGIALLLFDITTFGLDDANAVTLSGPEFNHYSPWEQVRLAAAGPRLFFRVATENFWPNQWRAWSGKRSPPPTTCLQPFQISNADRLRFGFRPLDHSYAGLFSTLANRILSGKMPSGPL